MVSNQSQNSQIKDKRGDVVGGRDNYRGDKRVAGETNQLRGKT